MTDPAASLTCDLFLDVMLAALRAGDERLSATAVELFGRFGELAVPRLVSEAVSHKNRPKYRLRVLTAIRRIGVLSGSNSLLSLLALTNDKNTEICTAAVALLKYLRERDISRWQAARATTGKVPQAPQCTGKDD